MARETRDGGVDALERPPDLTPSPEDRLRTTLSQPGPVRNAMTIDVEDYFQVSVFAHVVARESWDRYPVRVGRNVERVLALMGDAGAKATFFTLGWVAERYPELVRRIVAAGHELASHGCDHRRVSDLSIEEFRDDARRSRLLLEDIGGVAVRGYRAPSFSIDRSTPWAHQVLAEVGYTYSSSIYPVRHDHYGMPDSPRHSYRPAGENGVIEHPMTTLRLWNRNFPCSGGGYFRLLPYGVFRWAIRRLNGREAAPAIFYFHPWEIDPDQPRQSGLSPKSRFRHYVNLGAMEGRLRALTGDFTWDRMDRVFSTA